MDRRPVAIELEYRPHAQRFAFAAENVDPQKWKWVIRWSDGVGYGWGYSPWRWMALFFAFRRVKAFKRGADAAMVMYKEEIEL